MKIKFPLHHSHFRPAERAVKKRKLDFHLQTHPFILTFICSRNEVFLHLMIRSWTVSDGLHTMLAIHPPFSRSGMLLASSTVATSTMHRTSMETFFDSIRRASSLNVRVGPLIMLLSPMDYLRLDSLDV